MLEDDPAYQLICRAKGYLRAAELVMDEWASDPNVRAPVTHLLSHGIEVLLKHALVMFGGDYTGIRKEFGHEILKMWRSPDLSELRGEIESLAVENWERARASGRYTDTFRDDPKLLLGKQVEVLDRLHSWKSDHALRYVSKSNETAPIPPFLVETFGAIAKRLSERYLLSQRAGQYA